MQFSNSRTFPGQRYDYIRTAEEMAEKVSRVHWNAMQ